MVTGSVQVRDALPSDTAAMREITRNVWNGDDYLPFVWDGWLADGRGRLLVATVDGRLAGLQHIAVQEGGIGWVEGIRVREEARNGGIGGIMLEEAVRWGDSLGLHALRLATSSGNGASGRIAEKAGFVVRGTYLSVHADPLEAPATGAVSPLAPGEVARARQVLSVKGDNYGPPLYTEGWTAHALTDHRLRLLLGVTSVLASASSSGAIITSTIERPAVRIGWLNGDMDGMVECCRWARVRAQQAGITRIRATVLDRGQAGEALREAGFSSHSGNTMLLHERLL